MSRVFTHILYQSQVMMMMMMMIVVVLVLRAAPPFKGLLSLGIDTFFPR